jgi:hypothetical protein
VRLVLDKDGREKTRLLLLYAAEEARNNVRKYLCIYYKCLYIKYAALSHSESMAKF